jgi:FAD:protein FMN transferase
MLQRLAIPVACAALLAFAGCGNRPPELVLSGPTMGTTYTVKVVDVPPGLDSARLRSVIDEVLADTDRGMSGYRADSEIARFNTAQSTEWFDVSRDVAAVVAAALEVSALSEGAFDITVAPLVAAWGFGPEAGTRTAPDAAELARLSERVGFGKLHVRADPPALRKEIAELTVDLNGVAPGFAVDRLADRFAGLGIEHFMIEIGGEVRAAGRNSQGEPWRIAIERPDAERTPYAIVQLEQAAVATSGEYRNYYVRDGQRYSHTIDPRTARPIEHGLGSVAVVGRTAAEVDAWATALNVLGSKDGYELAQRQGIAAMFIEKDGRGWRSRITPQFAPYQARQPGAGE